MVETHISAEKMAVGKPAEHTRTAMCVPQSASFSASENRREIPQVVQRCKHIADGGCNGCACRALFQTGDENRVEYDVRNRADHAADHGLLARAFRAHDEAGCCRPDDERCAERDVNRVAAGKLKCACVRAEQVQDGRGEAQQYGGKRCADDQARP